MDDRELVAPIDRCLARRPDASATRLPASSARWLLRIALPIAGAATMLAAVPVLHDRGRAAPARAGHASSAKPGISADTTIGNWQFPHVDGLPIGVHITPQNVDLLRLTDAANANLTGFTDQFRHELNARCRRSCGGSRSRR